MIIEIVRLLKSNSIFTPVLFLIDLLLFLTDLLATMGSNISNPKKLCIIKVDKLGDYIFARNYFKYLKQCEKYKDHHVTYIGNIENKKFIDYLDKNLFDSYIWINIYKYSSNIFYRYQISRKIYKEGFGISFSPNYGRVLVLDDYITFVTHAKIRIGQKAHHVNIKKWEVAIGNLFYSLIINTGDDVIFEFERNRNFFEMATGEDLSSVPLKIDYVSQRNSTDMDYVVITPGAADKFREWSVLNFTNVADYVISEMGLSVILCGSQSENAIGEEILRCSLYQHRIINKMGRMDIPDLFETYYHCKFMISNETGAVHIGAALDKTIFCVCNGNHFKKWTEYPKELNKKVYYIYPPEIDDIIYDTEILADKYEIKTGLDFDTLASKNAIDSIKPEKVIGRIKAVMSSE